MGEESHPHSLAITELTAISGAPAQCEPTLRKKAAACTTPRMGDGGVRGDAI